MELFEPRPAHNYARGHSECREKKPLLAELIFISAVVPAQARYDGRYPGARKARRALQSSRAL
jgi:hypothetical protein